MVRYFDKNIQFATLSYFDKEIISFKTNTYGLFTPTHVSRNIIQIHLSLKHSKQN